MATANSNLSVYDPSEVPSGSDYTIALVVSEWNSQVTEPLFKGAYDTLIKHGVLISNISRINVPVVVIGSVIQCETKHFDFVCQGVVQGIKDLNIKSDIPVIFCVLTDNNLQQALDRSGGKHGNKGVEAAVAALKMASLSK